MYVQDGRQTLLSLIRCSIGVDIHLLLEAQILFLYFVVLYRIALGIRILMNMKILPLVCYILLSMICLNRQGFSFCPYSMLYRYFIVYADASFLDEWSLDQFQNLLNRSNEDAHLKQLLHKDNLVIFLHLLGCDSNGHAHRPYSSIYLNNVRVVDRIAEKVYDLIQSYFKDNLTSYVFTADHGMSDKGWICLYSIALVRMPLAEINIQFSL